MKYYLPVGSDILFPPGDPVEGDYYQFESNAQVYEYLFKSLDDKELVFKEESTRNCVSFFRKPGGIWQAGMFFTEPTHVTPDELVEMINILRFRGRSEGDCQG